MVLNTVSDDALRTYVGHVMQVIDTPNFPPPTGEGGGGVGANATNQDDFLPAAAATYVDLSMVPTEILMVSRNGVVQSGAAGHYTLAGQRVTFNEPFSGSERVIVAYGTGEQAGTPPNASAQDEFLPANGATYVDLSTPPTEILIVSRDGAVQSATDGHYSLDGSRVTFADAFDGTERVVVAYATGAQAGGGGGGLDQATADTLYVNITGDTMTGGLLFSPDGMHSIGSASGDRPYEIYTAGDIVAGGMAMLGGDLIWPGADGGYNIGQSSTNRPAFGYFTEGIELGYGTTEGYVKGRDKLLLISFGEMRFQTNNLIRWRISTAGHLLANTDNLIDIGASGANRPRDLFLGRNLTVAGSTSLGTLVAGATTLTGGLSFLPDVTFDIGGLSSSRPRNIYCAGLTTSGQVAVGTSLSMYGPTPRIIGPMSGAAASRLAFQNSAANTYSLLSLLPSGTGSGTYFDLYSASDPANASYVEVFNNNVLTGLISGRLGTGTYLPLVFSVGGSDRLRIDTTGVVTSFGDFKARDVWASRGDGTGVFYFAADGLRFLHYDATRFNLMGGNLYVGSGILEIGGSTSSIINSINPLIFDMAGVGEVGRFAGFDFKATGSLIAGAGYVFLSPDGSGPYLQGIGTEIRLYNLSILKLGSVIGPRLTMYEPGDGSYYGMGINSAEWCLTVPPASAATFRIRQNTVSGAYTFWHRLDTAETAIGINGVSVGSNGVLLSVHGQVYGGTIYSTTGQFVTWPSEGAYKANVQTTSVLDKLTNPKLRGVEYNVAEPEWTEEAKGMPARLRWKPSRPEKTRGFRAEDWAPEFPDLVVDGPGDIKGFSMTGMIPITWEAVREVYAELLALRERVAALEAA